MKKGLAAMEAALKKLGKQESKYSAELGAALQQYRELQAQAAEFAVVFPKNYSTIRLSWMVL